MPGVRNYQLADGDTGEVLVDRDGKNVVLRVEPRRGEAVGLAGC